MIPDHDQVLSHAFDGQSALFERAPVQTDPEALERLVRFADLPSGSSLLDAGCGPGLVAEAFLRGSAGYRVTGVDLSSQMIERAQARCRPFAERAVFHWMSLFDPGLTGPFDAVVSRYVLHHAAEASTFLARQVELLRPGGILVLSDHTTDPDPDAAAWHREIERLRDQSHTRNLPPGEILDTLARLGLEDLRLVEEPFRLDFDEWFDRGTPSEDKATVRRRILDGPGARGFRPREESDGGLTLECVRVLVRATRPSNPVS